MAMTDLGHAWGSGMTHCLIDRVIDQTLTDAGGEFFKNNTKALKALGFTTADAASYHDLYEKDAGDLAEELSEYENNWLHDGGEFWYQCRVLYFAPDNSSNETGKPEAYLCPGSTQTTPMGETTDLTSFGLKPSRSKT